MDAAISIKYNELGTVGHRGSPKNFGLAFDGRTARWIPGVGPEIRVWNGPSIVPARAPQRSHAEAARGNLLPHQDRECAVGLGGRPFRDANIDSAFDEEI